MKIRIYPCSVKIIRTFFLLMILLSVYLPVQGQAVKVPATRDKYARYVKQLEAGTTDIDYTDFRNSFMESSVHRAKGVAYDSLRKLIWPALEKENYATVRKLAVQMLSYDYTSIAAHNWLQQACDATGDTAGAQKYHDIAFGLITSILNSGDGKSCGTGFRVVQIEEEYTILSILDCDLNRQSLVKSEGNVCDKMEVKSRDGRDFTVYFEAGKILADEEALFGNGK